MVELAWQDSGLRDGPAIVLGHALGADHRIWDEVSAILGARFRVLRWDQPGHGASPLLGAPGPRARAMSEVVEVLLGDLDRRGIGDAHFAGISLGGMVSLAVSQAAPERVLSLEVLDAGPSLKPASVWVDRAAQVRALGMSSLVDSTMDRWFAPDCRAERYRRTRATFLACDPEGYAQCCEVIAGTDLEDGLGELGMPTLILTGAADPGMTPADARAMAGRIRTAGAPVIVPGSGHLTCLHDPVVVARAIEETALSPR